MKISVIMLTWNGATFIGPCLQALLAQDPPASEVIVVDNASADGTPDLVAERFPDVCLIRNSRNLGFSAGNNVGLRAATGDLLVLLNQDTEVHPGFLRALAATFDDPTVGVAGCKLLYPDGTVQHAGGYLYGPRGETGHTGRSIPDDGSFDAPTEPDFVTAAALGISRTCLARISFLDEGFGQAYYEDVDWCYRARAAGWRVVYVPDAVVTHHESTTADRESHRHKMNLNHGRVRFLFKHWPAARLLDEFGPAEVAWVTAMPRITELMAARGAYLSVLLDLPGILAFRASSATEAQALSSLVTDLRAAALVSLETLTAAEAPGPVPASPAPQATHPTVTAREAQQPPLEQAPLRSASSLSRLWARLHRLWTGLRYLDVLPDLVRQVQQHEDSLARQRHLQQQQGQTIQGQARDVAQNIRELTAIVEYLGRPDSDSDREP